MFFVFVTWKYLKNIDKSYFQLVYTICNSALFFAIYFLCFFLNLGKFFRAMGSKTSMLKNIAIGSVLISMVIFIYLNVFIIFVISFGISIDVFGFVDPIHYASLADMKKQ